MTALIDRILRRTTTDQENPMDTTQTTTPNTGSGVVMRFLTQGGATVELHHQDHVVRRYPDDARLMPDNETRVSHGFNWRCLGCGSIGGGGKYGMGDRHFDEYAPDKSRTEANSHATACRAMPRPDNH